MTLHLDTWDLFNVFYFLVLAIVFWNMRTVYSIKPDDYSEEETKECLAKSGIHLPENE